MAGKKVVMFVYNSFKSDARVLKEAKSLTGIGYKVTIIALLDKDTVEKEIKDGFSVIRIARNPFHQRFLALIKKIFFAKNNNKEHTNGTGNVKVNKKDFGKNKNKLKDSVLLLMPSKILSVLRKIKQTIKIQLNRLLLFIFKLLNSFIMLFNKPLTYYDYYLQSFRVVKKDPADIYHAHDLNTIPVAWYSKWRLKGKLVYDAHELFTEVSNMKRLEKKVFTFIERKLITRSDQVITVCDSIAEELKARYKIKKPTVVMNCPANTLALENHDLIRDSINLDENEPIILYQGGFSPNRGLHNLILAARHFKAGSLVLMGWGRIEDELRKLVVDEQLEYKVFFIPPVPQDQLLYWSSSADLGVIPYQFVGLNNYYSCPNKLFEYIAAGIAVAGSNFPELSRVINGYEVGITFNPEDPQDIANAINKIILDEVLHNQMCSNARNARKMLSWQNEGRKLFKVYEKVDEALVIPARNFDNESEHITLAD